MQQSNKQQQISKMSQLLHSLPEGQAMKAVFLILGLILVFDLGKFISPALSR